MNLLIQFLGSWQIVLFAFFVFVAYRIYLFLNKTTLLSSSYPKPMRALVWGMAFNIVAWSSLFLFHTSWPLQLFGNPAAPDTWKFLMGLATLTPFIVFVLKYLGSLNK